MDIFIKKASTAGSRNALRILKSTGKLPPWFNMKNPEYTRLTEAIRRANLASDQLHTSLIKARNNYSTAYDKYFKEWQKLPPSELPEGAFQLAQKSRLQIDLNSLAQRYRRMIARRRFVNLLSHPGKRGKILLDTFVKGKYPQLKRVLRLKNAADILDRNRNRISQQFMDQRDYTHSLYDELNSTPRHMPWYIPPSQRKKKKYILHPDTKTPALLHSQLPNDPDTVWKGTDYADTVRQYQDRPSYPLWASPRINVALGYAGRDPRSALIQFDMTKVKDIDDRTGLPVNTIDSTHMANPSYRQRLANGQGTINKGRAAWGLAHDYQTVFVPMVSAPLREAVKNVFVRDSKVPQTWRYATQVEHPRYSALQRQMNNQF